MRTWIVGWLVICSMAANAAIAAHTKKTDLTRVTGRIQELQKNIVNDQEQQHLVEHELQKTEVSIGDLSQQINQFNAAIDQEQQQLNKLKAKQRAMINKLAQENTALTQQMRAAYQLGKTQSLKIVLNQENPNTVQRYLTYYGYLTQARLKLIAETHRTLASLKEVMESITLSQQNLKMLLTQKQMEQGEQELAQKHREILLGDLHQNVQTNQQRLTTMVSNQKALQVIVSRLKQQTTKAPQVTVVPQLDHGIQGPTLGRVVKPRDGAILSALSFDASRGKLTWPVQGKITAHFHSTLDVGSARLTGIILKAALDTPVHSIYSGKVIFANWLRGFGLLIIIDHGNDYISLYGRNRALYAKVGDHVNTGEVIATTGNSGGFDKASLYFEIRKNGSPLNPSAWCR